MKRLHTTITSGLLGGVLLACPLQGAAVQNAQKSSSRIVAFSSDADKKKAEEPKVEAPASVPQIDIPKSSIEHPIIKGKMVPPPPQIVSAIRQASYAAKQVVATARTINSPYGVRTDPITGVARMHTGVDLHMDYGDSVGASMAGTVSFVGVRGGYGNLVVIDHGNGISTYYAHLSGITVSVGMTVEAGDMIGLAGSTGRATGPHLHYEVRAYGNPLDPFTQIEYSGAGLKVHGKTVDPNRSVAVALPKAPGGTTINVIWNDGTNQTNGMKQALLVDFE